MTSQTSQIISDVADYYNDLVVNHRKLDSEIQTAHNQYQSDQHIKSLKLNKLHLKQQIEELKSNLETIISQ
jgi:hypothetical protein